MKSALKFSLLRVAFITLLVFACEKENAQAPFYLLKIRIDPSSNRIEGEAKIQHPPDSCFYLNKDLEIRRFTAKGYPVSFHRDPSKYLPYTVGTAVVFDTDFNEDLLIEYAGSLTKIINGVNMINSDLVELALYAAWYPMFEGNNLFDFRLDADLPSSFLTTSNGILEQQQDLKGRHLSRWISFRPDFDIVLLASPHLQKMQYSQNSMKVEIFYSKMPTEYIEAKKDNLMNAMSRLSSFYGSPRVKGILRFVYSPRSGWGYSRIPFFVISEEYALMQKQQELGQARDFHDAAHEMAHFWWIIADPNTPDDWLNEGLAEFSAFRLSEEYFGKNFADLLVSEYREHATQSQTGISIAETESSSEDRYVNRYEKMTLILLEARRRFGQEHLDQVFRALHNQFAETKNATTESFLDEVENQLGSNAKTFFLQALFQKKWCDPKNIN